MQQVAQQKPKKKEADNQSVPVAEGTAEGAQPTAEASVGTDGIVVTHY